MSEANVSDERTTVTYTLRYRLTGPLYAGHGGSRRIEASTDGEAVELARKFCAMPWVGDTVVEVDMLTKTTTVSRTSQVDLTAQFFDSSGSGQGGG